jgi:hypothetical protein
MELFPHRCVELAQGDRGTELFITASTKQHDVCLRTLDLVLLQWEVLVHAPVRTLERCARRMTPVLPVHKPLSQSAQGRRGHGHRSAYPPPQSIA